MSEWRNAVWSDWGEFRVYLPDRAHDAHAPGLQCHDLEQRVPTRKIFVCACSGWVRLGDGGRERERERESMCRSRTLSHRFAPWLTWSERLFQTTPQSRGNSKRFQLARTSRSLRWRTRTYTAYNIVSVSPSIQNLDLTYCGRYVCGWCTKHTYKTIKYREMTHAHGWKMLFNAAISVLRSSNILNSLCECFEFRFWLGTRTFERQSNPLQ